MESKRVTLTLPVDVYNKSKELTKAGIFSSLSELFRTAVREEVEDIAPLLEVKDKKKQWVEGLMEIREEIKKAGGYNKTNEQVIQRIREIREEIWQQEYAHRY
ncbi:MAG: hypothetical protein AB1567_02025 [bacterium]